MAESITIWFFLGSILLYFIPQASNSFTMDTLIKLGSLILISPIAYFIAREFERRQRLDSEIEVKTEEIIQEAQALKEAGSAKTQEESDAINTIIEEATSLKEDSEIN